MISVTGVSSAGYYTGGCAGRDHDGTQAGPAEYYAAKAESGEPPGVWLSNPWGLEGEVDAAHLESALDRFTHPLTDEVLGNLRTFRTVAAKVAEYQAANPDATPEEVAAVRARALADQRTTRHGWDITFSPVKSVSVLHAALEAAGRHEDAAKVWAAVEVGITTALEVFRQRHAWTRVQARGEATRFERPTELVTAMFRHHTSRERDPQLHAHVMVLNLAPTADGSWKALFSPAITRHKHELDAIFSRSLEVELTRTFGAHWATRPDGKAREVVGVSAAARDLFSARSRAVVAGAERLVAAHVATYGREPAGHVLYLLNQRVTLATRKAKAKGPAASRAGDLAGWERRIASQIREGFTGVLTGVDEARDEPVETELFDPERVVSMAVAGMARHSSWTRSQLYLEVANRLPAHIAVESPADVVALLDELVDMAVATRQVVSTRPPSPVAAPLPRDLVADEATGLSVFDPPVPERFTTRAQLARETAMVARLDQTGAPTVPAADAERALEGHGLSDEQRAVAMAALTSTRRVLVVDAAAGTGKSRTLGAIAAATRELTGRDVVGFATAQNAAQVLQGEGIGQAHNIARWLDFTDRAEVAGTGPTGPGERSFGEVRDDERELFAVEPGSTVFIDEGSMVSAQDYQRLGDRFDELGVGRIIIVGDSGQVDAVEQGGTFALLAERADTLTLETVRRFAHDWERDASTAVRDGRVEDAVRAYESRGRLHGGPADKVRDELVRDTVIDILAGRDVVAVTSTSDLAADVSSRIREGLVAAGRVEEGVIPLRDGTVAGVGDVVQARANDRTLPDGEVTNREVFRVTAVAPDGRVEVQRADGRNPETGERVWSPPRELPAAYARDAVELAYAGTVHAVQGRNAEVGRTLAGPTMGRAELYPANTRGVEANHVYLPLGEGETAAGRFAAIVATDTRERSATATIRDELDRAESLAELGPRWQSLVNEYRAAGHRELIRDVLGADGSRALTDPGAPALFATLRGAEHRGHDVRTVLEEARAPRDLEGARSFAAVMEDRVSRYLEGRTPEVPERVDVAPSFWAHSPQDDTPRADYIRHTAAALDGRLVELGMRTADEAPAWATARLGPVPERDAEGGAFWAWVGNAATAAGYREWTGHADERSAIGARPADPDRGWLWDRAADRLGVDPVERDLTSASRGALELRVDAWTRDQVWAPPNVDSSLRVAHGARDETDRQLVEARVEGREVAALESAMAARDERVAHLEEIAAAREAWHAATAEVRDAARPAARELERRDEVERERAGERAPARDEVPVRDEPARVDVPDERVLQPAPTRDEPAPDERVLEPAPERVDEPEPERVLEPAPARDEPAPDERVLEPEPARDEPAHDEPAPERVDTARADAARADQEEADRVAAALDTARAATAELAARDEAARVDEAEQRDHVDVRVADERTGDDERVDV